MDGVSGGAEWRGWDAGCGLDPRFCVWGCGRRERGAGVTVWTHSLGRPLSAEDSLVVGGGWLKELERWWGSGRNRGPTKLGKGTRLLRRSGARVVGGGSAGGNE